MTGSSEIRWDLDRIAELISRLRMRHDSLHRDREIALVAGAVHDIALEMRHCVIAAEWCRTAASKMDSRRRLLASADVDLLGLGDGIGTGGVDGRDSRLPEIRAGSSAELDVQIRILLEQIEGETSSSRVAVLEMQLAQLTLDQARAVRANILVALSEPPQRTIERLNAVIDLLEYELARAQPRGEPDWVLVMESVAVIRRHLDESWLRDVSRKDLLAINEVLESLTAASLEAVMSQLSDSELYRWLRELDGIANGNLTVEEEGELFRHLAVHLSAPALMRIARAERGGKFGAIAEAVRSSATVETAMQFLELCAVHAGESEAALVAAIDGIAALEARHRRVVYASLVSTGSIQTLRGAASAFVERHGVERTSPLPIEFLRGARDALAGTVDTVADLGFSVLHDTHEFREAWASVGRTVGLVRDPLVLLEVLFDIGTLRRNPARWLGGAIADLASYGANRLARLGKLGALAKSIADWLKRAESRSVLRVGRIEVEAGHVATVVERLHAASNAADMRQILESLSIVEGYADQLSALSDGLDKTSTASAIAAMNHMLAAADAVLANVRSLFPTHLPSPQMAAEPLPAP